MERMLWFGIMWWMVWLCLCGRVVEGGTSGKKVSLDLPFQSHSFERLKSSYLCVSLMTRNGRVGCGTYTDEPMSGILLHHEQIGNVVENEQYVLLCKDVEFSASLVQQYQQRLGSQLSGFLVVNSTDTTSSSSSSWMSPGSAQLGESGYTWNPQGDGLTQMNLYGTPVALVTDADMIAYLVEVSQQPSLPAIVVDWNLYMGPTTADSPTCLSWKDVSDDVWRPKCLPLGGNSVWATSTTTASAASTDTKVLLLTTNMDATSMFHEVAPGANMAASNILTVLLTAKLLSTVDLPSTYTVGMAFFQGEQYGPLGSSRFFTDLASFTCQNEITYNHQPACLYPLRPDLAFQTVNVAAVMAVDQIAVNPDSTLYVHTATNNNNGNDNNQIATFWSNVMLELSDGVKVASDNGDLPPSALTEFGGDGVVLAGYDSSFQEQALYQSHRDSNSIRPIDLTAVTKAATLMARSIIATLYSMEDYATSAAYAKTILPDDLSTTDETVVTLADCLLENGNCDFLLQFANMERTTAIQQTSVDLGLGTPLQTPPTYYTNVYDINNGQAFVSVNNQYYGSYSGTEFGNTKTDSILLRPSLLEMSLHGLLNNYLGRPSSTTELQSCKSTNDCSSVTYCPSTATSTGDDTTSVSTAVCSGEKVCVCSVSHYHVALDLGVEPAVDDSPGKFTLVEQYSSTPLVTEPYWSSDIGVRVYRKAGTAPGLWTLTAGIATLALGIATCHQLKKRLILSKLY